MPWSDSGETYTRAEIERANGPVGVVIGRFTNPPSPLAGMESIGTVMSDALRTRLAERSDLSVRRDDALGKDVEAALAESGSRRTDALHRIQRRDPTLRYVILGKVTDFTHDFMIPTGSARNGIPGQRSQAIVALRMEIVDLHHRRVAVTNRVEAMAWGSDASTEATYRGVAASSARFWDTPLGMASHDAVAQSADRFNEFSPTRQSAPIRIVDRLTHRRVRLASDALTHAAVGSEWFVCAYDSHGTNLQPVLDPDTNQPLKARIESRSMFPTAWLMGEPPEGFRLNRAVLTPTLPRTVQAAVK